jgi:hypothetical protein
MKKRALFYCSTFIVVMILAAGMAWAADPKPNILVV